MANIRFRKNSNYVSGQKIKFFGGTGQISMKPNTPGGGGVCGTQLNPCVLLTDGTPQVFTLSPAITATLRTGVNGSVTYGRYFMFTAPTLGFRESLRIRYGVQTDGVDNIDTYLYLFDGLTWTGAENNVQLSEMVLAEDDESGVGDTTTFENTNIITSILTPGETYYLEATTATTATSGNVKVIADVLGGF